MQAIILCAGIGSRIHRASDPKPKALLDLGGSSILERQIAMLQKARVREIIVVTGYLSEQIERKVAAEKNLRFIFNPFYRHCNVIGSFWFGQSGLQEEFIFLHGDTIFEPSILADLAAARQDLALVVDIAPTDKEAMKVSMSDGRLLRISKEIEPEQATGEFIGLAKFSATALERIKSVVEQEMRLGNLSGFFEVALQRLIQEAPELSFGCVPTSGRFWREIDFKEDYDFARRFFA